MIVVTGSSGFVGRRIVSYLDGVGYSVCAVSRDGKPLRGASRCMRRDDVLKEGVCSVDSLIHLEVKQHVEAPSSEDLDLFRVVNVEGTKEWLDWCSRFGVRRFVFFSSVKAVKAEQVGSGSVVVCNDHYGHSKRAAEALVIAWARQCAERSVLIVRPAVICGPGNTANMFSMVRSIDQGIFFLLGPNDNLKSLVSIGNVVAAVHHLLRNSVPGVQVYNLVDKESFSVRQIAEMIAVELGRKAPIRSIPPGFAWLVAEVGELWRSFTGKSLPLTRARLRAMLDQFLFSAVSTRSSCVLASAASARERPAHSLARRAQ